MNWTLTKLAASVAAVGLLAAVGGNAQAACDSPAGAGGDCIYIDLTSTGRGTTDVFDNLGFTNTLGTSIYTPNLLVGSPVYDTNLASQLQAYGIAPGSNAYSTAAGSGTVNLQGTPNRAARNIDALGTLDKTFDDVEGFENPGGWGMLVEYELFGTLVDSPLGPVANYTSGYFDLLFDDFANNANDTRILRANVLSSMLTGSALQVIGQVTYDFDGDNVDDCSAGTLCAEFFNFDATDSPLFPIHEGTFIHFVLESAVVPGTPALSQLGVVTGTSGAQTGVQYWARQTGLSGLADFELRRQQIPEPETLALLGAGLVGVARLRRKTS